MLIFKWNYTEQRIKKIIINCYSIFIDRKIKENPTIEDIVKVLSPSYKDFYRAKILNIGNNNDFHVFYIDFGNTEVVQSSDIFELSDELKIKVEFYDQI